MNQATRLNISIAQRNGRWFPTANRQPPDEELFVLNPPGLTLASHDADWIGEVVQQQSEIKVALMLIRIFSFDRADVTGEEGNKSHNRSSSWRVDRHKTIERIKSSHTNMLLHPVPLSRPWMVDSRFMHFRKQCKWGGSKQGRGVFCYRCERSGHTLKVTQVLISVGEFFTGSNLQTDNDWSATSIGFSTIMRNGDRPIHRVISVPLNASMLSLLLMVRYGPTSKCVEMPPVRFHFTFIPLRTIVRPLRVLHSLANGHGPGLNPEWVLLDADEQLKTPRSINSSRFFNEKMRVGFPKFDMWNETHYRTMNLVPTPPLLAALNSLYRRIHQVAQGKVHSGRHPLGI